jgi:MFS family permease
MQSTAQGYLVFELTNSPAYLGYVGFAAGLPSWLFTLYGGVVADRMPRRKLLLITQISMMVLAIILASLTYFRWIRPWHIIVMAFFLGIANAFDAPARQAFVTELVDREDLTNAIALNSTMFNTATVLGPAFAGLTYALFGPALCFTINAISFIAVIGALVSMNIQTSKPALKYRSVFADLSEGVNYSIREPVIRIILLNLAVVSLFGLGFITLMPAWAVNVLGGDASTNGYLQSTRGLGALLGALLVASTGRVPQKGKLFTIGSFTMPLFLLLFSTTRDILFALLMLIGVGWGFMMILNLSNSIVQTHVRDGLRGRVMGLYTLTFFGLMPVGSLINGVLADRVGEPLTVQINGLVLMCLAVFLWFKYPSLRATKE